VTYILAFDRSAVASALQESGVDSGEEYLEKIVQVSFDLPTISEATLSSFITEGIDILLAKYRPAQPDMERFGTLFHAGFRRSFLSVRHVRRFLNGLEFSLALIGRELNGADIIGIEAIKTFYPRTFDVIRSNKALFAGHIDPITKEFGAAEYKKKLDQALSQTKELSENLSSLLTKLFPKVEYGLSTSHTVYGAESETEWEQMYRVATERYFDAYFQLTLAPSEVSVVEVSHLIHDCGNEASCLATLRELTRKGKLRAATDSLRFRLQEVQAENLAPLLAALIQIGEIASEAGSAFGGSVPEYWHVRWVIFDILGVIADRRRPEILLEIANRVVAPKTMLNVISLITELRQKQNKYEEFSDHWLARIKGAVAERIKTAAANGEIPEASENLSPLLYAWREWGNPAEAAAYVQSLTNTNHRLARFLDKFIYQTHSTILADGVTTSHNRVGMKQLSESLELNALGERLSLIDLPKLQTEDRAVVELVLGQLKRMREKGLTPEQFDNSRLFLDE
jgi:hypothetical protein